MERAIALLLARGVSGLVWFMAGFWKCFELGPIEHARRFFVEPYAEHWMPVWSLWAAGTAVPVVELAGGALLLLGWRVREAGTALAGVLLLVTYGHLLAQPLFPLTEHVFPRAALLLLVLLWPRADDRFSLDAWLARRSRESPG